ncbi:AraC family transcriptional regulator [Xylanimonas allomyrinae]|uniref:AraC family transcriptional regulator n=1 Tax=Xylanimonas allomyrinae TaxID=2509459 RepID=A0A4P6EIC9_9MICO|nr:GyrI-like domain-containing protein [Xylanimonas allomyrinae]QAY62055.1 AraC family transcriptional regulator [Xylanimonas allomyrinae]
MSSTIDAQVRAVPAVHVASLTRTAPGYTGEEIGPVVEPMFTEAARLLEVAGVAVAGPPLAQYDPTEPGEAPARGVLVTVAFPVADTTTAVPGLDVQTLPAIDRAAVTVYRGGMDGVGEAWMAFMAWLEAEGHTPTPTAREVYVLPPQTPEDAWTTELVQPLA